MCATNSLVFTLGEKTDAANDVPMTWREGACRQRGAGHGRAHPGRQHGRLSALGKKTDTANSCARAPAGSGAPAAGAHIQGARMAGSTSSRCSGKRVAGKKLTCTRAAAQVKNPAYPMPQRAAMHERSRRRPWQCLQCTAQHPGRVGQSARQVERKAGGRRVVLRAGGRACATRTVTFSPGCSLVPNISHGSFRASGPSSSCARRQTCPLTPRSQYFVQ